MNLKRNKPQQGYVVDETQPEREPRPIRQSIRPTYDSRETGPRFHVTYSVNGKTLEWRRPIEDPFVCGTVVVDWRDLLKSLWRRKLIVEMHVGGDPDIVDDVMELDSNTLTFRPSTRRNTFNSHLGETMSRL